MVIRKRLALAVLAMALVVTALAARLGSKSAGGADSYGYISQADGWLAGDVLPHQRFLEAQTDRPVTQWAFSPLGWKPSKTTSDLVPIYAPGYPMILALFKLAGGHAAMFWVVPLMTGILVWATYLLGCALARPGAGAVAALLVATSATVLYMSMAPMSDVPSAALWTLTLALVLGRARVSAVAAGAVCALAILVRPNLMPLAGFMGAWLLVDDVRVYRARLWLGRAWPFALFAGAGALVMATLNTRWYGHAGESGYGDLGGLFNAGHVVPNLARYPEWLVRAETPLAAAGLLAVLLAPAFVNRRRDVAGVAALLWVFVAWIWGMYCYYLVFDAWWYLRFLLPTFPLIALGAASLVERLWTIGRAWRAVAVAVVVASTAASVTFAWRHAAFRIGFTESRYPQIARDVAALTDPASAIITLQHSGSVRYYGGRMTVRWDVIGTREFATMVAWLRAHGHHPFLLVDAGELNDVRARFAGDAALAPTMWPPLASFFGQETMLFDLDAAGPSRTTPLGRYTRKAIPPAPPPRWSR